MYKIVTTKPFEGQKPGTSGLRKKTKLFMSPHYLENFIQSTFNAIGGVDGKRFVLGGDGRFFGVEAAQTILKMAAANGAKEVILGQNALLSTPAASHLIRINKTDGGIIMSASHNPGGVEEDFGVKFNAENGGPANESITNRIFEQTKVLAEYRISDAVDIELSKIAKINLDGMIVNVIDSVSDYADLMAQIFDFTAIKRLFASGFSMRFDAMNAITGPYAKEILEKRLGASKGTVVHGAPLPDFGGMHPDPNPTWAHEFWDELMSADAPDFGAASDGDGDRNMVLGKNTYITPSDSLAILTEHALKIPAYTKGLNGVARSMPTGSAVDHVAKSLGIECYETPTGWKFFGNLLDAGRVSLCGEESFGTGSDHIREKDGLWAVLFWLNILAVSKKSVSEILQEHWARFGRTYFSRHDFEDLPSDKADAMIADLSSRMSGMKGASLNDLIIKTAEEFSFLDPVDGTTSNNQGFRVIFENDARIVARLSGTGTSDATLRLYLELYDKENIKLDTQQALEPIILAAHELLNLKKFIGKVRPDVIT